MTYEYLCEACGHRWEADQRISEDPIKECPSCGEPQAKRQISLGGGFILKGGGWYSDLYSSTKPDADKPDADSDSGKAESDGKKVESKSEDSAVGDKSKASSGKAESASASKAPAKTSDTASKSTPTPSTK